VKFIDPALENYCVEKSNHPGALGDELEAYTKEHMYLPQMLTGKMEASFLGFLIRSIGVKRIVEFGTFTGYSALSMAENLPDDGEIFTFDINEVSNKVAREFWAKSEHGKKITPILKPGLEGVKDLQGQFDLVFIDADKCNYINYFNWAVENLSDKGIIVVDNALWSGSVLKTEDIDESTQTIKDLNDLIASRDDLYGSLLPVRDGMFLVKKL
jgi:caffeoyl-CoA O-methyltransferase